MKARNNYLALLKIRRRRRANAANDIKKRAFSKIYKKRGHHVLEETMP